MSDVIDLGDLSAPAAPLPKPPLHLRVPLAALSIVLLALLGGAAFRPPPVVIHASLADNAQVVGDRLYLVHAMSGDRRTITVYGLPRGNRLRTLTLDLPGSIPFVIPAGPILLAATQIDDGTNIVVALDATSGRQLWRKDTRLNAVSVADGIALLATDTQWQGTGLSDGVVRWTVPNRNDGYSATDDSMGYPSRIYTLQGERLMQYDAHTGKTVGSVDLPPRHGYFWPSGGLVLVDVGGGTAAYGKNGLEPLWRDTVDLRQTFTQGGCGPVICAFRPQNGMLAINLGDGSTAWESDRWVYAASSGNLLLANATEDRGPQPLISVLDPLTGRVLGDFGNWQSIGPAGDDGRLYGVDQEPGGTTLRYGILDPHTRSIDVLGTLTGISGDCESGTRAMICRQVDASVLVVPLG